MLTEAIQIYRSRRFRECEDRAFMLTAVGIPNEMTRETAGYVLWVDPQQVQQAREHLELYQRERLPPPVPLPPLPLRPDAWIGCVIYALVLIAVAWAVGRGFGRLDAFDVGELDAAHVQAGQWWRAWTALTLHVDAEHLIANLGAGIWFGYIAGRLLGPGIAWLLTVEGAALANLLEALAAAPEHRSVGASTAVFTSLGLLTVYTWLERHRLQQRWALRYGPLVAGVVLLGWFGTEGENTDVVAHLAGFICGGVAALLIAREPLRQLREHLSQRLAGALAVGSIVIAWICGLTS